MSMDNAPEVRHEFLPVALDDQIRKNLNAAEAEATTRAHAADWSDFVWWCEKHGRPPLPANPHTVAAYISGLAEENYAISTISRRLASISVIHRRKRFDSPTGTEAVRTVFRGIRNRIGSAKEKKLAIRVSHIRQVPSVLPDGIKGVRDLALILLGYCGAFRRSELVALDVSDLEFVPQGVRVTLRRSKTDQAGVGRVLDVSYACHENLCPVHSLKKWLATAEIEDGPVFRGVNRHGQISDRRLNDRAVSEVIKEIAEKIGLDPKKVGGHSLRAGFVTDGLAAGLPTPVIRRFSGHKTEAMLAEYYREACLFDVNVTSALGL